jgi:hypothetical protein
VAWAFDGMTAARRGASGLLLAGCVGFGCLLLGGCKGEGSATKVVYGAVTCGGEKAPLGKVTFVPIGDTPGPATGAPIVDGQYRIDARGGVKVGKYRVCVDARKKTGKKVFVKSGREAGMRDEEVSIMPPAYAGDFSPLEKEVKADSDGRIDLELPRAGSSK